MSDLDDTQEFPAYDAQQRIRADDADDAKNAAIDDAYAPDDARTVVLVGSFLVEPPSSRHPSGSARLVTLRVEKPPRRRMLRSFRLHLRENR